MKTYINKNTNNEKGKFRKFGVTMGLVFCMFGVLFLWRQKGIYPYFFTLAGAFLLLGLALPLSLKPVHKFWMGLAAIMGWVMTRIILSILFYLIVTPIGLVARGLFKKDFLDLKFSDNKNSYWIPRDGTECEKTDYERQF